MKERQVAKFRSPNYLQTVMSNVTYNVKYKQLFSKILKMRFSQP